MSIVKKTIFIAGVLLLMATGSYAADSIVMGTEQVVKGDVSFAKPVSVTLSLTAISGLEAGHHKHQTHLATGKVTASEGGKAVVIGDYNSSSFESTNSIWNLEGKNQKTHKIRVNLFTGMDYGPKDDRGNKWWKLLDDGGFIIQLDGDQDIEPDVYTVTVHAANYQA
ncbi:TPA: hypothetical protein PXP53_003460 [Yersinia enterocolitica]|nr:hypothetical protein [Yersinia enterocolitica]